jgi:ABC-type antimicrobial peptide transport system permease subunit
MAKASSGCFVSSYEFYLSLNKNYVVVGVMPDKFYFPGKQFQLWLPLSINPNSPMAGRGMHYLQAIGRLKPEVSLEQAKAEMDAIGGRLEQQYPRDNSGHGVNVFSLQEDSAAGIRSSLLMIQFVVGFVLLIACANVANLLLARATARQKEIALRSALGASRTRIVRQLLTESILLSLLGGTLGLTLAAIGIRLLVTLSPGGIPRIEESALNGSVVAFTFLTALATGIVFGLAPALQISKPDINELLKAGSARGSTSAASNRLRKLFVVIEVALSLVLLIGAGLMIKSFVKLVSVSPGFNVENILTGSIPLLEGRQLTVQDSSSSPNVVIINDVMAQRYWLNESALDKEISIDRDDKGSPIWRRIIGVVLGVRHTSLELQPEAQMYTPYTQFSMPYITLVLHTKTAALDLTADLRHAVSAVDKDQPISKTRTMEQVVSESTAPRRFNMVLLSLFAGSALFLASIGIYGVISYLVTQRTREIGIRSALGARRFDILKLVISQGMALALIGAGIGLAASFALTRTVSSLLFSVSTTDPLIFLEVTGLLLGVALLACYLSRLALVASYRSHQYFNLSRYKMKSPTRSPASRWYQRSRFA